MFPLSQNRKHRIIERCLSAKILFSIPGGIAKMLSQLSQRVICQNFNVNLVGTVYLHPYDLKNKSTSLRRAVMGTVALTSCQQRTSA